MGFSKFQLKHGFPFSAVLESPLPSREAKFKLCLIFFPSHSSGGSFSVATRVGSRKGAGQQGRHTGVKALFMQLIYYVCLRDLLQLDPINTAPSH